MTDVTGSQGFTQERNPSTYATGANEYWTDTGMVRGALPEAEARTLAARSMAVIADPQPLGLAALAAATWTISTIMAGWYSMVALPDAVPIAIYFGGVAQFLAGMWAFRRGHTLAATAFSAFGSFYVAFGVWVLLSFIRWLPATATGAMSRGYVAGWFIVTFGVVAAYLAIAALADNPVLTAILATLSLAFIFDGVGMMVIGTNNWALYVGGYCGIVSALLAFYLSAALVINASFHREVVPTFAMRGPRPTSTQPTTGTMRGPTGSTATSGR